MDEIDRSTWAARFAARLQARTSTLSREEALADRFYLFQEPGQALSPEEAADALSHR